MDASVAALVLLAALLHAGWNALVKVSADRLVVLALLTGGGGVIACFAIPFLPAPAVASWPYIGASVALHAGYNLFLLLAYRHGDFGQVYPIARGTAPLRVAVLAAAVAGERLGPGELLAVLVISAGIIGLAFRGGPPVRDDPRPVLYALATAAFIAAYTLVDGLGARAAGTPHGYAAWLFACDMLPLPAVALWLRRHEALGAVRRHWRAGLGGGAMSLAAYWLVIWAMTLAPMATVAALREVSVVFAAVLATVLLKERFGPWRIAAATAVALGVVLLRI